MGKHFFSDKVNLKKVSDSLTRNPGTKTHFPTNPLYILHPYKHLTEYISKGDSQRAEGALKKIQACPPSRNKSTERQPRVPHYSPPTIAGPLQPALLTEPASMQVFKACAKRRAERFHVYTSVAPGVFEKGYFRFYQLGL